MFSNKTDQELLTLIKNQDANVITRLKQLGLNQYFEDPIMLDLIVDPKIVPQGTTYAESTLVGMDYKDPNTRENIKNAQLNNLIFNPLVLYYLRNDIDTSNIPNTLCCPLSKKIFIEPVVANDGKTYERVALIEYLETHNNTLPNSSIKNTIDFNRLDYSYKNSLARELIEHTYQKTKEYVDNQQTIKAHLYFAPSLQKQLLNKKIRFLENLKREVNNWRYAAKHSYWHTFFNVMPAEINALKKLLNTNFQDMPNQTLEKISEILRETLQTKSVSENNSKIYLKWNDQLNNLLREDVKLSSKAENKI